MVDEEHGALGAEDSAYWHIGHGRTRESQTESGGLVAAREHKPNAFGLVDEGERQRQSLRRGLGGVVYSDDSDLGDPGSLTLGKQ